MTTARNAQGQSAARFRHLHRLGLLWLCILVLPGCLTPPFNLGKTADSEKPADSITLAGGGADKGKEKEKDRSDEDAKARAQLEEANRLLEANDLAAAEKIFTKLAKNLKNPLPVVEESLFKEAECQRLNKDYRHAEPTYKKLLKDFPRGQYAERATVALFEIANFWLEDTRREMEAYEKNRDKSFVFPTIWPIMHFSKDRPFLDQEGHALQCLEEVYLNDLSGPLGEKALFYLATVRFFRHEYRDADEDYQKIVKDNPNGKLAEKAIKQSIICKEVVNGGSCYNAKIVEEARRLVDRASNQYPELREKESDWLNRQIVSINLQQADRDFNTAEFYKRTHHPGSAYFYYELVRRCYPNTVYADKAVQRMDEIRAKAEREQVALQKAEEKLRNTPPGQQQGFLSRLLPTNWLRGSGNPTPPALTPLGPPTMPSSAAPAVQ